MRDEGHVAVEPLVPMNYDARPICPVLDQPGAFAGQGISLNENGVRKGYPASLPLPSAPRHAIMFASYTARRSGWHKLA